MASLTTTRSIASVLTTPSKLAQALDWRKVSGNILSLTVVKDRIELALAAHPSFESSVEQLPSIPLEYEIANNRKVLKPSVAEELSKVMKQFHVTGTLVSWPVQRDGWCGAQCGRVLHTLDQLVAGSKVFQNRPVVLWDEQHNMADEDEWGRMALYSRETTKSMHVASQDQYETRNQVAVNVWNDYMQVHWPELWLQQQQHQLHRQQEQQADVEEGEYTAENDHQITAFL